MPNTKVSAAIIAIVLVCQSEAGTGDPWWNDLAAARELYDQGRYEDSAQSLATVVKWTTRTGPAGSQLAGLLGGIGSLYFELGRFDEGRRHLESALVLCDERTARLEPRCLRAANNLIALYTETKQFSRAQKLGEETVSRRKDEFDRDPSERVHTLHNLATVYYFRGRYEEAESLLREALMMLERQGSGEDPQTMYALVTMAPILVRNGKPEQALASVQRARGIGEKIFGRDHVVLARGLIAESAVYRSLNQTSAAGATVQRALAIIPETLKPLRQSALDEYARIVGQSRHFAGLGRTSSSVSARMKLSK